MVLIFEPRTIKAVMLLCPTGICTLFHPDKLSSVTDDESSVYCSVALIRLFSKVLHNTKSSILCDILPNLCRTELSRGQQPVPTEHSICHIAYKAQFWNVKLSTISVFLYFCTQENQVALKGKKNIHNPLCIPSLILLQYEG